MARSTIIAGSSPSTTPTTSSEPPTTPPSRFADRLWNLYFLASRPDGHRSGAGTALVQRVEHDLQRQGEAAARILIVETSSLDAYRPARTFYARAGFREEARITDFYGPGDDKITFWRSLLA